MKNDEKKLIDDNTIDDVTTHVATSLGGLIYQRIKHLKLSIGTQKEWDVPEMICELQYLQKLIDIDNEGEKGDMFDIESGIMFDMWAHIVCIANATKTMDLHFCPKHFAKGVHEHLTVMYYG